MAGRAPAGAMAASVARRHQLGYRADDAGSRTARFAVLVQAEENLEGETAIWPPGKSDLHQRRSRLRHIVVNAMPSRASASEDPPLPPGSRRTARKECS